MEERSIPRGWQAALTETVNDLGELEEMLGLGRTIPDDGGDLAGVVRRYPLRVPRSLVARMRPGDPHDPLLLQVLPTGAEAVETPGYSTDPLAEAGSLQRQPSVLRKYRGRALLMVTGACAAHCRYCFRRHLRLGACAADVDSWRSALAEIANDVAVEELILSGGDPLVVDDPRLHALVEMAAAIPQLRRLRVHTRLPVLVPERITDELLTWLTGSRLQPVLVLHVNHAREVDRAAARAVGKLRQAGVTVLNQAVLLARVNDSVEALCELSTTLFEAGALPYYLHLLDRVQGAAHFEVDQENGKRLLTEVAARLPGYLVPRLVRETPGAAAKIQL